MSQPQRQALPQPAGVVLVLATSLRWLADDPRLGQRARLAIVEPDRELLVSVASLWEARIKQSLGKLDVPDGFCSAIAEQGFRDLVIRGDHTDELARLPMHHRDPFDRLLVAQARCDTLTLVTRDERSTIPGIRLRE